jgi:GT2 family glycosyltransferase
MNFMGDDQRDMISASIVTYNQEPEILQKTISSFLSSSYSSTLYIVDNSPTDILRIFCEGENIKYFFGHGNIGFGAGHNLVIKNASFIGKYHLVLNPDISFNEGVLESLIQYMESNEDVGLTTPKVFYPNGEVQYLNKLLPRPFDWIGRLLIPSSFILDWINNRFELRFTNYNKIMNVPYISGCFMLIRSAILSEIGFFDEKIFMYGEDTDLSRRIHMKYKTVFYPFVSVIHEFQKGSYKEFRLFKIHIESALYYFNKWGWFFDKTRRRINDNALNELGYYRKNRKGRILGEN